jgi:hypothetical protein
MKTYEYLVEIKFSEGFGENRMFESYKDAAAFINVAPALFIRKKIRTIEMLVLKNL